MDKMKGWRTLGFNAVVALVGVVVAFNWGDVLDPKATVIVTTIVIPMINGWLRTLEKGRFSTALLSPEQAPVLRLQQAEARANCGHNA